MPSLIDLRRRIRAVKSTQQITKAMKMIAASRLKRAQERVVAARPFAQRMLAGAQQPGGARRSRVRIRCCAPAAQAGGRCSSSITADRGLCGSFNSNVIKAAGQFIAERDPGRREIALGLIGRKGRDFFRRRGFDVRYRAGRASSSGWRSATRQRSPTSRSRNSSSGRASSVHLVYNEFKSVMSQRIVVEQLLPIPRLEPDAQAGPTVDYLYEPAPEEIFRDLLPRYVQAQVYRALLESNAAFFAAQMTAMDAATRNSAEMIENLTLYMNKVRQAAITREIIEVVSGAVGDVSATGKHGEHPANRLWHRQQQRNSSPARSCRSSAPSSTSNSRKDCPRSTTRSASCPTAAAASQKIDVVAEVEQHLGENRVRAVAMKPTDGMTRGMTRDRHRRGRSRCRSAPRRSAAC